MPWLAAAVAASSIIGGASSIMGGNAQAHAADNASNIQNSQYLQTRQDLTPYRNAGYGALGQINALLGLGGNTQVGGPSGTGNALNAPPLVGQNYANQSSRGKTPIQDIQAALALGRPISDMSWSQAGFGPGGQGYYPQTQVAGGGGAPGAAAPAPDAATAQHNAFMNFQTDPGYQFALDQGSQALQRSAAARGILNSGATAKALTDYGQGMAAQQYGNYFNRLQSLAGIGQSATNATGQFGASAASGQGNALMAAGGARASAYGGVAQSGNQGIQNYLMSQYLGNGGGYATPSGGGGWNTGPQGFPIYN